jgi:hypothetical protein
MIGRNSVTEQTGPGYLDSGKSSGGSAGRHSRVASSRSTSGVARTSYPAAGGGGSAPGGGLIASAAEDARATTVCPIRDTPRWRSRAVIRSSSTIRMFATRSPYPLCVTATSQFVSPDHCNTKIIGHGTALTQGARPNTLTPAGWRTVLGA